MFLGGGRCPTGVPSGHEREQSTGTGVTSVPLQYFCDMRPEGTGVPSGLGVPVTLHGPEGGPWVVRGESRGQPLPEVT